MKEKCKTRRSFLHSVVLVCGGALACALIQSKTASAQQKASKEAMKYQDKSNGEMRCSNCQQFIPPNGCKVVEGTISPNGYCIAWVKKS